jgi:maltooligosyltrehalose synthase
VLIGGLLRGAAEPVGDEVWGATKLAISNRLGASFRNLFTGELLEAEPSNGRAYLPLRRVLANFPVALLIGQ